MNIVRESISNSLRHSHAAEVVVSLRRNNGQVQLEIGDDGRGFLVDEIKGQGYGLRNIFERVREIDGQLEVISSPGRGARIIVTMQVKEPGMGAG